ncbi:hypothetical protein [Fervidobacterium pennivorans]|nr:hypothetical protein [Fervidobacterium pennivorans]
MSKKRDVKLFLQNILDEIQRIKRFVEGKIAEIRDDCFPSN